MNLNEKIKAIEILQKKEEQLENRISELRKKLWDTQETIKVIKKRKRTVNRIIGRKIVKEEI